MIPLEQFNELKYQEWRGFHPETPYKNGIACPVCTQELYDTDSYILTCNPPKRNVHCDCGYKGYRYI